MEVYVHGMACTPTEVMDEMCKQVDNGRLSNIKVSHVLVQGNIPWKNPKYYGELFVYLQIIIYKQQDCSKCSTANFC